MECRPRSSDRGQCPADPGSRPVHLAPSPRRRLGACLSEPPRSRVRELRAHRRADATGVAARRDRRRGRPDGVATDGARRCIRPVYVGALVDPVDAAVEPRRAYRRDLPPPLRSRRRRPLRLPRQRSHRRHVDQRLCDRRVVAGRGPRGGFVILPERLAPVHLPRDARAGHGSADDARTGSDRAHRHRRDLAVGTVPRRAGLSGHVPPDRSVLRL